MPGALETTCGSPCGMTAISPSSSLTGSNAVSPTSEIQHEPRATTWNSIAYCAPGVISPAICAAAGASATQGDLATTSKNTEPDKCTAERTSDSASVLTAMIPEERTRCRGNNVLDARAGLLDDRARTIASPDAQARNMAARSFSAGDGCHSSGPRSHAMCAATDCRSAVCRQLQDLEDIRHDDHH